MKKILYILSLVVAVLVLGISEKGYANSRHPISNFRSYNYYEGMTYKSLKEANELIERKNLVLINTTEYEYWEELEKLMREEGDDYYDFLLYDYYVEGKRLFIYSTNEAVEKFLKYNTPEYRAGIEYSVAKIDFIDSLFLVYEYSLTEYREANADAFSTINDEIDADTRWGSVFVQGFLDKKLAVKADELTQDATIVLKNLDDGRIFNITLSPYDDYETVENVTEGWYEVHSAFLTLAYPATVSAWQYSKDSVVFENNTAVGKFFVGYLENVQIDVVFGEPFTMEEYIESRKEAEVIEEPEVVEEPEAVVVEEKTSPLGKIIILSIFFLILLGIVVFICYIRKKIKDINSPS